MFVKFRILAKTWHSQPNSEQILNKLDAGESATRGSCVGELSLIEPGHDQLDLILIRVKPEIIFHILRSGVLSVDGDLRGRNVFLGEEIL